MVKSGRWLMFDSGLTPVGSSPKTLFLNHTQTQLSIMAKSKSFFGLRRGSTKAFTFQVLNGQQVTKDRVSDVKNPRTQSQMVQRMVMATTSAAYAAMRQIADHSFEGVSYGQMSMAKFSSINNKLLRDNLSAVTSKHAYNKYQDRGLVPGCYQLSAGSLPTPSFAFTASSGENSITIAVNGVTAAGAAPTANELASFFGLSLGEMATICMIYANAAADGYNFSFVRIRFDAAGTTVLTTSNFSEYFTVESDLGDAVLTVAAQGISLAYNADITDAAAIQRCCIYSRKSNNSWLRSTAVFNAPGGMVFAPTAEAALATYPVGTDYILNGGQV